MTRIADIRAWNGETAEVDGEEIPLLRPKRRSTPRSRWCPVTAIVPSCPFCRKRHRHGWDTGLRRSHCALGRGGSYYLQCD